MKYDFPIINTINDVIPLIADRKEFIVAEKSWYDVVNYVITTPDTFPVVSTKEDAILRELRGVKFHKDGTIAQRTYHKFFNIGEREETQANFIDFSNEHHIMEKLDGSMISPLYSREHDGFRLTTKMGITDVAMNAEVFVAGNPKYFRFFREMEAEGLTPIFEWVSPLNRIVIQYKSNNLILTAIRNKITGVYSSYEELLDYGQKYDIPVVGVFGKVEDYISFAEKAKSEEDKEGYVIRFDDGHMVKIKNDLYLRMHKSKEIVANDRAIIELILGDHIDDIKPSLTKEDYERVGNIERIVAQTVDRLSSDLNKFYEEHIHLDRKEFALHYANKTSNFLRHGYFNLLDNKNDSRELAKEFLLKNSNNESKFGNIKKEFIGL